MLKHRDFYALEYLHLDYSISQVTDTMSVTVRILLPRLISIYKHDCRADFV